MKNYCTLFDSNYLSRGIALYESIVKTGEDFHLFIFCFDDICYSVLSKLNLTHATLITLKEFETKDLLAVKPDRTKGEYCWTSTPHVILHSLQEYSLNQVTYLDADTYFFQKPSLLLKELDENNSSIIITEHRYTPKYDRTETSGIYCVQFVTFNGDKRGMTTLKWWGDRCLEWCYAYFEDGKLGDQKYLDDWPIRFEGVHVLKHLGGGLAPWNIQQFDFFKREKTLFLKEKKAGKEYLGIFYHFHSLKFYKNRTVDLPRYEISKDAIDLIYVPYLQHLERIRIKIQSIDSSIDPHGSAIPPNRIKSFLDNQIGRLRKAINIEHVDNETSES